MQETHYLHQTAELLQFRIALMLVGLRTSAIHSHTHCIAKPHLLQPFSLQYSTTLSALYSTTSSYMQLLACRRHVPAA